MNEALEARLKFLEEQRGADLARVRRLEKWVDTVESPLWKRLWFVAKGYRWKRLGVWYRASWNSDGWGY